MIIPGNEVISSPKYKIFSMPSNSTIVGASALTANIIVIGLTVAFVVKSSCSLPLSL